jgi:hypothetical protein
MNSRKEKQTINHNLPSNKSDTNLFVTDGLYFLPAEESVA